jgi:3-carboxy-cis,cis-muconate cycloisomerase
MLEPSGLLLFSTPSIAAIFAPQAHVRGMLAFEAALARAEARVGIIPQEAQQFVHWGATSQDAIDTALMLQMRDGLDLLVEGLLSVCAACATLTEQHRQTLMTGRTLLQQAVPITVRHRFSQDFQRFVNATGALYAFVPSLSALSKIANGTI